MTGRSFAAAHQQRGNGSSPDKVDTGMILKCARKVAEVRPDFIFIRTTMCSAAESRTMRRRSLLIPLWPSLGTDCRSASDEASGRSTPCRAVLFVLRLDLFACLGPVVIGPFAQLIEVAAHRQCLAAVHRDGLAV